jgi:hypothetical protein
LQFNSQLPNRKTGTQKLMQIESAIRTGTNFTRLFVLNDTFSSDIPSKDEYPGEDADYDAFDRAIEDEHARMTQTTINRTTRKKTRIPTTKNMPRPQESVTSLLYDALSAAGQRCEFM